MPVLGVAVRERACLGLAAALEAVLQRGLQLRLGQRGPGQGVESLRQGTQLRALFGESGIFDHGSLQLLAAFQQCTAAHAARRWCR